MLIASTENSILYSTIEKENLDPHQEMMVNQTVLVVKWMSEVGVTDLSKLTLERLFSEVKSEN